MLKRGGIKKTITGGKIQGAFNLVDVPDKETGKITKKAVAVDIEKFRIQQDKEK